MEKDTGRARTGDAARQRQRLAEVLVEECRRTDTALWSYPDRHFTG